LTFNVISWSICLDNGQREGSAVTTTTADHVLPDARCEALTMEDAEARSRLLITVDLRRLALTEDQRDGWNR
jgi:hypothetical protein